MKSLEILEKILEINEYELDERYNSIIDEMINSQDEYVRSLVPQLNNGVFCKRLCNDDSGNVLREVVLYCDDELLDDIMKRYRNSNVNLCASVVNNIVSRNRAKDLDLIINNDNDYVVECVIEYGRPKDLDLIMKRIVNTYKRKYTCERLVKAVIKHNRPKDLNTLISIDSHDIWLYIIKYCDDDKYIDLILEKENLSNSIYENIATRNIDRFNDMLIKQYDYDGDIAILIEIVKHGKEEYIDKIIEQYKEVLDNHRFISAILNLDNDKYTDMFLNKNNDNEIASLGRKQDYDYFLKKYIEFGRDELFKKYLFVMHTKEINK